MLKYHSFSIWGNFHKQINLKLLKQVKIKPNADRKILQNVLVYQDACTSMLNDSIFFFTRFGGSANKLPISNLDFPHVPCVTVSCSIFIFVADSLTARLSRV